MALQRVKGYKQVQMKLMFAEGVQFTSLNPSVLMNIWMIRFNNERAPFVSFITGV